jgi:ribosomal protein L18
MNSIIAQSQEQILPESFKERLLLLSQQNQSIKKFPKILTFQIEDKKVSKKFLTKKKGRKKKSQEIKQEEEKGEKIVHSKFSNDNIKRRIKGLFNNYIINLLNDLIKKKFRKTKIKFVKMNIKNTKDIGIEFNRNLLSKPIKEIIIDVSNKYQDLNNNKNCIKFIKEQKGNEEIINLLNMSYKDIYSNYYLVSKDSENSFEAHKEKVLETCGKEYLEKFVNNAEGFIDFFMNGKNRKARKQKEIEAINIPIENEGSDLSTMNEGIGDNLENYFLNKNMACSEAQTDICGIYSKIIVFD